MNNDREPTITIIKSEIAELNNQIKTLSNDRYQQDPWNINTMNRPIHIKKFNSDEYSGTDKPFQPGVNGSWWRPTGVLPAAEGQPLTYNSWGFNLFPNDIAWWSGNDNGKPYTTEWLGDGTTSHFYYVFNTRNVMNVYIYSIFGDINLNGEYLNQRMTLKTSYGGNQGMGGSELHTTLQPGKNVFEISTPSGLPNSGHVFYVADSNKKVLFKSGDAGWGVTTNQVPDYNLINWDEWNINTMNTPKLLKKYNSTDYSSGPKAVAEVINNGWWGAPGPGSSWGKNYFPNDIAWWISIDNYMLQQSTMGFFYYIYNSPEAKNIKIYTVIDDVCVLIVNGQTITQTPTQNDYGGGGEFNVNLKAGKNVFELRLINYGGPGAFVFYAYDPNQNNKVLFKSGDPGWAFTHNQAYDHNLINNGASNQDKESEEIVEKINNIKKLIKGTYPLRDYNKDYIQSNIGPLLRQFDDLQKTYAELEEDLKKPLLLQGNYEISTIKVKSIYGQYMLYVLFTLFLIVSLFIIFKNPEVGNLDKFILVLAGMILVYYVYEYIQMRKRK